MEIAVVGLGAIGSSIALHLLRANHKVVVWNRSAEPVRRLVGEGAREADDGCGGVPVGSRHLGVV